MLETIKWGIVKIWWGPFAPTYFYAARLELRSPADLMRSSSEG